MRLIIPIFLLIIAGGLFFGMTTSLFAEVDALRLEKIRVNEDFEKALAVEERFGKLKGEANAITPSELEKLDLLLPKSVNTVDLLVKIDGIAKGSSMTLADVKINVEAAKNTNARNTTAIAGLGTVTFDFNVSGSYDALRKFLDDLERNLRLVDVSAITFNSTDPGPYQYNIKLKTYWLK